MFGSIYCTDCRAKLVNSSKDILFVTASGGKVTNLGYRRYCGICAREHKGERVVYNGQAVEPKAGWPKPQYLWSERSEGGRKVVPSKAGWGGK